MVVPFPWDIWPYNNKLFDLLLILTIPCMCHPSNPRDLRIPGQCCFFLIFCWLVLLVLCTHCVWQLCHCVLTEWYCIPWSRGRARTVLLGDGGRRFGKEKPCNLPSRVKPSCGYITGCGLSLSNMSSWKYFPSLYIFHTFYLHYNFSFDHLELGELGKKHVSSVANMFTCLHQQESVDIFKIICLRHYGNPYFYFIFWKIC